jgi:integrase
LDAQNQKTLKFLVFNKYKGVADLGYEGLNMQVTETSIHKTLGFSSYFFHTLIKQRQKQMFPHRIRHSVITAALDVTEGNVRKVQKLSRHKNLNTLMVYAIIAAPTKETLPIYLMGCLERSAGEADDST